MCIRDRYPALAAGQDNRPGPEKTDPRRRRGSGAGHRGLASVCHYSRCQGVGEKPAALLA